MGEGPIVWLAVFGGIVAAACALACAVACVWLARATRAASVAPHHAHPATGSFAPAALPVVPVQQPRQHFQQSTDRIPDHVLFDDAAPWNPAAHMPVPAVAPAPAPPPYPTHGAARQPIVLEGRYPQLGAALGSWMQVEPDEVERIRIARDLGTIGGAGSARALLDGVRTGVLSPTIAFDQLERGGFEAGIAVAAALRDPEPRVRALATSLVGRSAPLVPASVTIGAGVRPMPEPPQPPGA